MPLLFFFYPFAEIAGWWWFISTYSFWDAVLLCVTSALVGTWVLRLQGGAAFTELQKSAQQGTLPSSRVVHRILMSVGAFLLILPGLVAKTLGVLFIFPVSRHLAVWILTWGVVRKFTQGFTRFGGRMGPLGGFVFTQGVSRGFPGQQRGSGPEEARPVRDVIDIEAQVLENKKTEDS